MEDEGRMLRDPLSAHRGTLASATAFGLRGIGSPRIVGRYEPLEVLGQGAHGIVWKARDAVTGSLVALKKLSVPTEDGGRFRREVATLRALRVPGVVRLLDEGVDEGCPFLVMEVVDGAPFPGGPTPQAWSAMAPAVIGLLETLARIHAAGVVHRDLKPANVLVDATGRPTVLDFGVSFNTTPSERLTLDGCVIGTPAYLAPEQLAAEPVTARADLYAVGAMLYEALSGKLPFDSPSLISMLAARATRPAVPLGEVAPEVPERVARIVDQLLARVPEQRPRSAAEVLGLLHGEPAFPVGPVLPWLGSGEPLRAVLDAVGAGRSLDIVAPSGCGRTRLLREVTAALERAGRKVLSTVPGRVPLDSLRPVIGPSGGQSSGGLQEVLALAEQRVRAVLAARTVLVVDGLERVDRWSAALLDHVRGEGCVLRARLREAAGESAVVLAPLDETALQAIFAGPERLFHLPTDAARALWARTDGHPARVVDELDAWARAGLARRDGDRFAVDRDGLDRLQSGLPLALVVPEPAASTTSPALVMLPPELEELLSLIALAWPHTSPRVIAAAASLPQWLIEAQTDELVVRGALRRLPDGRVLPLRPMVVADRLSAERRRSAHGAVAQALPRGAPGRLVHLLLSEDSAVEAEMGHEACLVAEQLAAAGQLGQALAVLEGGVAAIRRGDSTGGEGADLETEIFALWVKLALTEGTPHALDRLLYELCRTPHPRPALVMHFEDLARAALGLASDAARASAASALIPPFEDIELERRRLQLQMAAVRRSDLADQARSVADLEPWASGHDESDQALGCAAVRDGQILAELEPECSDCLTLARASYQGWLGWLRYRQGRFSDAAAHHARVAESEPWLTARVAGMLSAASALMEAFQMDAAARLAKSALHLSVEARQPHYEARAEWLNRTIAYRRAEPLELDQELIDAVELLGVIDVEAMVCLTEGTIAWRAGQLAAACPIAERAHHLWAGNWETGAVLSRCLAIACGSATTPGELAVLAERASLCATPSVGLQALGLLAAAAPDAVSARQTGACALAESVPREHWDKRMDVMSVDEALSAVDAAVAIAGAPLG